MKTSPALLNIQFADQPLPSLGSKTTNKPESAVPAALAVVAIIGLQMSLLEKLTLGPNWLAPALELALLVPLMVVAPKRRPGDARGLRVAAVVLIGLINAANIASLLLLVHFLLVGGKANGGALLFDAVKLWLTNVILFALWFWELDRGGPNRRGHSSQKHPDFLFPQMTAPDLAPSGWKPSFLDYVFVSFTNAAAFSPTDTLPLTARVKMLMMVQALTSLLTVALVAGRAVNILP